jgi:shikimate dehydrogenase
VLARPEPADLLVNCTSVGLGDADALPAGVDPRAYPLVVDLVYRPGGTRLVREAERAVDGLEVLVQQGARSFAIWTGDEPDLDRMRAAVGAPSTRGPACR